MKNHFYYDYMEAEYTEILQNYYDRCSKKISPKTVAMHVAAYMRILGDMDPFESIDVFIRYLDSLPPATAIINLKAVAVIGKAMGKDVSWTDGLHGKYSRCEKRETILKGTYEDMKVAMERAREIGINRDYIILAFYYLFPIRNDLVTVKIRDFDPEKDNYVSGEMFVLNYYKTSKVYGRQVMTIPTFLVYDLKQYIDERPSWKYLLLPYEQFDKIKMSSEVKRLYKKFVDKPLTMIDTRKIKISHEYENVQSYPDMVAIASRYTHRVDTDLEYYMAATNRLKIELI